MTALSWETRQATAVPEIFGYQFIRRIGFGGMGEAVLARQLSLDRRVAIKILKPLPDTIEAEQTLRFEREALLMANLAHPNVVRVFDRGIVEGRPYLVMEYIEGGDLRRRMTVGVPMLLEEIRPLLRDVATALVYLHHQSILHRDLKPENILLDEQGGAKVTDFGIAVSLSETGLVTRTGQIMGTLDYIAPEQRYNRTIDERADQYSLAVLAYEMLTGHKPVGVFPPPSARNPQLATAVDEVLLRGLQQDPDDRYETLEEFSSDLDRALARPPRKGPARGLVAAVMAVVVLTLIAGVTWLSGFGRSTSEVAKNPPVVPVVPGDPAEVAPDPPPADELLATAPFDADAAREWQRRWGERLGQEVRTTNSLEISLILVPPGEFTMGTGREELDWLLEERLRQGWREYLDRRYSSEFPEHTVRLTRPFYLAATEVTVGQFRQFIESSGYRTDVERDGSGWGHVPGDWERGAGYSWSDLGDVSPGDDWPVVNVSYFDARMFCKWLGNRESCRYRLPSEAEWEFACRGGTLSRRIEEISEAELAESAVFGSGVSRMAAVGSRWANAFGIFDMRGNVWEWCHDRFAVDYYAHSETTDPTGPTSGELRVVRGGSFSNNSHLVRAAVRQELHPNKGRQTVGFRVLREIVTK